MFNYLGYIDRFRESLAHQNLFVMLSTQLPRCVAYMRHLAEKITTLFRFIAKKAFQCIPVLFEVCAILKNQFIKIGSFKLFSPSLFKVAFNFSVSPPPAPQIIKEVHHHHYYLPVNYRELGYQDSHLKSLNHLGNEIDKMNQDHQPVHYNILHIPNIGNRVYTEIRI